MIIRNLLIRERERKWSVEWDLMSSLQGPQGLVKEIAKLQAQRRPKAIFKKLKRNMFEEKSAYWTTPYGCNSQAVCKLLSRREIEAKLIENIKKAQSLERQNNVRRWLC